MAPGRMRYVTADFTVVADPPAGEADFSLTSEVLTPNPPLSSTVQVRITVNAIGPFTAQVYVSLDRAPASTTYNRDRNLRAGESIIVSFPAAHYGLGAAQVTFSGREL